MNPGRFPTVDGRSDRPEVGGGFTVLDGVAVVTGAAVALVHLRSAVTEFNDLADWVWGCGLLSWLTVTSAGPFVYGVRRFFTRPSGYPRLGDQLWALAGTPWFLAALVKTVEPSVDGLNGRIDPAYVGILGMGLCVVSMVSVPVVAAKYLLVDPNKPRVAEPTPWTNRLGLVLTVAWPIHCGVGLIVMS